MDLKFFGKFFEHYKSMKATGFLEKSPQVVREVFPYASDTYVQLCNMCFNTDTPWTDADALLDVFEFMFILPPREKRQEQFFFFSTQRKIFLAVLNKEFPNKEFTGTAKELLDTMDKLDKDWIKAGDDLDV